MIVKVKEKKYLTPGEVSELLMVSTAAVRRWAAEGELKAQVTPGGHRRFFYEDVDNFAHKKGIVINSLENKGLKVLIVDDDKQFSGYLMKMLSKYPDKITAELAENGFEAGTKLHSFNPDVVLLDLMMPGMDGFEVCEKLKQDEKIKSIKVIAMTGYPSALNTKKILEAGATLCLPKPINRNQLLEHLGVTGS